MCVASWRILCPAALLWQFSPPTVKYGGITEGLRQLDVLLSSSHISDGCLPRVKLFPMLKFDEVAKKKMCLRSCSLSHRTERYRPLNSATTQPWTGLLPFLFEPSSGRLSLQQEWLRQNHECCTCAVHALHEKDLWPVWSHFEGVPPPLQVLPSSIDKLVGCYPNFALHLKVSKLVLRVSFVMKLNDQDHAVILLALVSVGLFKNRKCWGGELVKEQKLGNLYSRRTLLDRSFSPPPRPCGNMLDF